MGLIILPILGLFAIVVLTTFVIGAIGANNEAQSKSERWSFYGMIFTQAIFCAAVTVLVVFATQWGGRMYAFSLYLYVNFVSLGMMILAGNLMPRTGPRALRQSIFIGTLFIFPISQTIFEIATRLMNKTLTY